VPEFSIIFYLPYYTTRQPSSLLKKGTPKKGDRLLFYIGIFEIRPEIYFERTGRLVM
jgi:hypothetical protein